MNRLDDIVQSITTGKPTEIDIWDKIVDYFIQHWDGQSDIFQQVKNLSRRQLGPQVDTITDTKDYFSALENNFSDKNDVLEFLINLTGYLNYTSELGSVNVKERLTTYQKGLRKVQRVCIKRGIFKDANFVGRGDDIKKIKTEITQGNKNGILLSGLGGMGKTCLASTVCYELRSENWKTTKIELREQRTFRHFLRTIIGSIKEIRGSLVSPITPKENDQEHRQPEDALVEESTLEKLVLEHLRGKGGKRIYLFDNIDDVSGDSTEKEKVLKFLENLLTYVCQIQIIVTSRENFLETGNTRLKELMLDISLGGLKLCDSLKLVEKCTRQTNLAKEEMNAVVRVCGACPLAIRVICDVINYTPRSLIQELEKDVTSLSTSFLHVQNCLQQSFERLEDDKIVLLKLSLFGTVKFSLKSATVVVFGKQSVNEIEENERKLKMNLLQFKSRHLIEIDTDYDESSYENVDDKEDMEHRMFSLHPLVYKFLNEKSKKFEEDIQRAKIHYLAFYDDLVLQIGQDYETDVLLALEKIEKIRYHLTKYTNILSELENFSNLPNLQNLSSAKETNLRKNVVEFLYNPEQHLSFLKSMASKKECSILARCSWEVEYVTAMIHHDMKSAKIEEICNALLGRLESFKIEDDSENKTNTIIYLKGRMLLNLGLLNMTEFQDESLKYLHEAKVIFRSICHEVECAIYLAEIYNCIGCIYYSTLKTTDSINFHSKALKIHHDCNWQNENTLTYYANIGACHFRLGKEHARDNGKSSEKFKREMGEAFKFYDNCIKMAQHLKLVRSVVFVKQLKSRGNVSYMLSKFDDAEKDYKEGLNTVKLLYDKPNRQEIILNHSLGELLLARLRDKTRTSRTSSLGNDDDDAREYHNNIIHDWLEEGIDIYEDIHRKLNPDIMPTDDHLFEKIKQNHLYFLRQMHETEKQERAEIFYRNYGVEASPNCMSLSESSSSDSEESDEFLAPLLSTDDTSSSDLETSKIDCNEKEIMSEASALSQKKQDFKLPIQSSKSIHQLASPEYFPQKIETRRSSSSSSGVSSLGNMTPDFEGLHVLGQHRNSDTNEMVVTERERKHKLLSFRQSSFEDISSEDEQFKLKKKHKCDKFHGSSETPFIPITQPSDHSTLSDCDTKNSERVVSEEVSHVESKIHPERKCFKLPLQTSTQAYLFSPACCPKKITRRNSSSSSGVSSLGTITPDFDNANFLKRRASIDSNLEEQEKTESSHRKEPREDIGWTKRRSTLKLFGSNSLDYNSLDEMQFETNKRQKFDNDLQNKVKKASSFDEFKSSSPSKQRSHGWVLDDKLTRRFQICKTNSSSQTELRYIDTIADELGLMIPSKQQKIKHLITHLSNDTAYLVDDDKGRPIIQYMDSSTRFENDDETAEV